MKKFDILLKPRKILAFLIALISIHFHGLAQECFPFGLTITSQEQIDQFAVDYPACDTIDGGLYIEDLADGTADIFNLDGLTKIVHIKGDLEIYATDLITSLEGLNNVVTIEGDIDIQSCDNLESLDGLDKLTTLEEGINLRNLPSLNSLVGMDNLAQFGGELSSLSNLDGLENLQEIGSLSIIETEITEINGLNSLTNINGFFYVNDNENLQTITGFNTLEVIQEDFDISENPSLQVIDAFHNLEYINDFFLLYNNPNLTDLFAFEALVEINGLFEIFENQKLENSGTSFSQLQAVRDLFFVANNENWSNFPSFESLEIVDGDFTIEEIPISELSGFNALTTIGGTLNLSFLDNLQSIDGFNALHTLDGSLIIRNNDKLESINGPLSLEMISAGVYVSHNPQLYSIDGLQNIDPTNLTIEQFEDYNLVIAYNPELFACNIEFLCQYFSLDETNAYIGQNGATCDSEFDIITECLVATDDNQKENKITIYPNPATNLIHIDMQDLNFDSATIITMSGNKVPISFHTVSDGILSTSVNNLTYGVYILQLKSNRETIHKLFYVQHH